MASAASIQGAAPSIEGSMALPTTPVGNNVNSLSSDAATSLQTLNEPVLTTIMRDVKEVGAKLRIVLLPTSTDETVKKLQSWDLWGPLILCLALSMYVFPSTFLIQSFIDFS